MILDHFVELTFSQYIKEAKLDNLSIQHQLKQYNNYLLEMAILKEAVTSAMNSQTSVSSGGGALVPTSTPAPIISPTPTPSLTSSPVSPSSTPSKSVTPSITPTATISETPSTTPTPTISKTPSITPTSTLSVTPSITPTPTISNSPSITLTPTISNTPSITSTPTVSETPSITPTPTISETPSVTPTVTISETPSTTPTPSITSTPITGFGYNLVSLPYTFPVSGTAIMNNTASITSGSTDINALGINGRGFYFNSIDNSGIDRTSYFSNYTSSYINITFTQNGNSAIYYGDTQSLKLWSQSSNTGFVFGTGISVPSSPTQSGVATLLQSGSTPWIIGDPVYITVSSANPPSPTPTPTISVTPSVTPTPTISETPSVTPTPTISETPSVTPTPTISITPTISTIATTPSSTPAPSSLPGSSSVMVYANLYPGMPNPITASYTTYYQYIDGMTGSYSPTTASWTQMRTVTNISSGSCIYAGGIANIDSSKIGPNPGMFKIGMRTWNNDLATWVNQSVAVRGAPGMAYSGCGSTPYSWNNQLTMEISGLGQSGSYIFEFAYQ